MTTAEHWNTPAGRRRINDEAARRRTLALTGVVRKAAAWTSNRYVLLELPHGTIVTTTLPIRDRYGLNTPPGMRWMRDWQICVGDFSGPRNPNAWDHYATATAEQLAEVLHDPGTTVTPFGGAAGDRSHARRSGAIDPDDEAAELAFIATLTAVRRSVAAWGC